jgi:hypothetical protein
MKKPSEVRAGLVFCLGTIRKSSGYSNDLEAGHIYNKWIQTVADANEDILYPKCFVVMETGSDHRLIGENERVELNFAVVVIVKKRVPTDDVQDMIDRFLDDIEKMIKLQDSLNGTVHDVSLPDFAVDGGALEPEGALVVRLHTERFAFS